MVIRQLKNLGGTDFFLGTQFEKLSNQSKQSEF